MSFTIQFLLISLFSFVAGSYFLWIGIRGFIRRRAFLIPARQLMWFLIACYVPQVLTIVRTLLDFTAGGGFSMLVVLQLLNLLILIMLGFVFWRQFSGYIAIGISEDTFRDALTTALRRKNIVYEETIGRIRLQEPNTDLQIAVAGWVGTAQIRSKKSVGQVFLTSLAQEIDQELAQSRQPPVQFSFILYSVVGVFLIILSIVLIVFVMQMMF